MYERRGDEWVETARLLPPGLPPQHAFGRNVVLGDGVAAVMDEWKGGWIHLFERGSSGWAHVARLRPVPEQDAYFGERLKLALGEGVLAVGDPLDDSLGDRAGAIHVYERTGGEWRYSAKLFARDAAAGEELGGAVAVEDRTPLAGSRRDQAASWGVVHVFDRTANGWHESRPIEQGGSYEWFGYSVALSGDRALVGGYPVSGDEGSAYLFRRQGDEWLFEAELGTAAATDGDGFGFSVDLHENRAVVGAVGFLYATGRALLFEECDGTWYEIGVLEAVHEQLSSLSFFGGAVSVSGKHAAAAGLESHYAYGDCECASATEYCVTSQNSTGEFARIHHAGSLRVSDNAFELRASLCPGGEIGFFFYGPTQNVIPFGAGYLCVSAGTTGYFRFPPQITGGPTSHVVDFTAPPADSGPGEIVAGSTWYFQFAFRDGSELNFTEGLRVLFGP